MSDTALAVPPANPNYGITPVSPKGGTPNRSSDKQIFENVNGEPLLKWLHETFIAMRNERIVFEKIWEDIDEYISPLIINPWRTNQVLSISKKIFDGTPITATRIMTNGFVAATTPSATPWISVDSETIDSDSDPQVQKYLNRFEEWMYKCYNRSNYHEDVYPFVSNGVSYGTAARIVRETSDGKNDVYETLDHKSFFIRENEDGIVDTLFRHFPLQNRVVVRMFGDFLSTYPEGKMYLDNLKKNPNAFTRIVHSIFPRTDFVDDNFTNSNFPWASVYWPENGVQGDKSGGAEHIIFEVAGYRDWPADVWRYQKIPGFAYGLCPGIWALRDCQVLNQQAMTLLRAMHMAVDPPWMLPQDLEGREELFPGGRMFTSVIGSKPEPLVSGMNLQFGNDAHDRLVNAVNDHFGIKYWLAISQMQAQSQQMTATQVDAIKAEEQAMVQSMVASYESQVLEPGITRMVNRGLRRGEVQPFVGQTYGKQFSYTVHFVGPMAQLSRRLHITGNIQQFLSTVLPVVQAMAPLGVNPAARIDWDQYIGRIADGFTVADILKTIEQVNQEKAQAQQLQQQQLQTQQMQQQMAAEGQFAKNTKDAPQPGSPLQMMLSHLQQQQQQQGQ